MALTKISGGVIQPDNFNVGVITATSLNAAGVVTASTVQVGSATTIHTSGIDLGSGSITSYNINSTGIITASRYIGNADITGGSIVATAATFTGNVSIGGTLTYEDVTNIDSVGVITARTDVHVGAGLSVVGVSTFANGLIVTGGSVGIGTNNPEVKCVVYSTGAEVVPFRVKSGDTDTKGSFIGFENIGNSPNGYNTRCGVIDSTSFSIFTSNNERLRITSDGNVGIGLTNPVTNLTVYGNASAVLFQNSNTGTTGGDGFFVGNYGGLTASIWQYENDVITFGTNNTERLRITSSGNVGIGTDNPTAKLTVAVADGEAFRLQNLDSSIGGGESLHFALEYPNALGSSTGWKHLSRYAGSQYQIASNIDNAGYGVKLSITEQGKVSIGTEFSPGATLHIRDSNSTTQGSAQLKIEKGIGSGAAPSSVSRENCYIHLGGSEWGAGANGNYLMGFGYTNGETGTGIPAYIGFKEVTTSGYTYGDLIFGTRDNTTGTNNATERLRITSTGDVGIGTDDPESFKLKIQGSTLSFGNLLTDARQVYYTNLYNTNGWGNDGLWHTVCPHTLANNSVYLVSLVWDWGGSVGQPYYLATQTLYSTVNGANGTGSENELTPLASTHTGSSGARINVRTLASTGGSNTSGLQVNFTGFSSGANSYIIVKCWRLMYNTRSI